MNSPRPTIGRDQGPSYHSRYFQLKSYSRKQKEEFINTNKAKYLAFGVVSVLLQLVPGASVVFLYTNTVGAALWAAELEKAGQMSKGEDLGGMELGEVVKNEGAKESSSESKKEL